ncbi:MAG: CocE/NonD family hydrolase [Planctomycetaceae bacterium]|nr:CocE/NonD family hydrolase [Planctomycetaceae bacterium]
MIPVSCCPSAGRAVWILSLTLLLWAVCTTGACDEIVSEIDVPVPMRDGTVLRANVFRPAEGGPWPVLVWRTPYGKAAKPNAALVRAGYIVVQQDARGRYASEGDYESFVRAETSDGRDGYDTVQWASTLPNSTGKVGLIGTSYPGFLAWRAAGTQPPALTAMGAFSIPASYLDLEGPGTIRPGRRLKWWWGTMSPDLRRRSGGAMPHTNADATQLWNDGRGQELLSTVPWSNLPAELFASENQPVRQWLLEPWHDPWQLGRDAEKTTVPNLNVCGWYDHCNGSIDLHQAISENGGSFHAKRHSRMIIGPWSHTGLGRRRQGEIDFGPDAELNLNQLTVDWFDHWIKDKKNQFSRSAPVRLFVMGINEWRDYYEWPPRETTSQEWFLSSGGRANTPDGDGRLLASPPDSEHRDLYDYDPHHPVPTQWTSSLFTIPADQAPLKNRVDILVYQSQPLTEFVETIGYARLFLHASSNCPDTDFFARLIDVFPDGTAIDVTSGMIRARYRSAQATPESQFLVPGQPVEFEITLRPTAHRFLPGHRIRLDITSSDFPNYDRHHNTAADQNADAELVTATQTVLHGPAHLSRLVLPVTQERKALVSWAQRDAKLLPPRFVREFGTEGDQPGEFHSPVGIAIDSQDRIYVTEFRNKRVQVFDVSGHSVQIIPVESEPGGIAVDQQGRIYVALMLGHRIVVFDPQGTKVAEWGTEGSADGQFSQPGGIAIATDGSVLVVDQQNHRIQRFTPDGQFVSQWGEYGSEAGQFGGDGPRGSRLSGPHFAAIDAAGHVYTTEGANLRIQKFSAEGVPLQEWTGEGDRAGRFGVRSEDRSNPFEGPIGVVVDHASRIWVSSTNNRVQCFSPDGEFLTGMGIEGAGQSEFIIPHGLAVDSKGRLYVVDASNQRVQVFETRLDDPEEVSRMERLADAALVPPVVNVSPLPEYGYDRLDYGMTIGIERTPGGRLWACWVAGGDSPKAFFVLATSDDNGETWSDPRVVLDSHSPDLPVDRSILVGNLWTDPKGRLWLIFDQSMHMFDGRAGVWASVCENPDSDQPQWSEPRRIWHGVTLNKPTVLTNGEWMLPISLDQREGFAQFRGCFRELDPLRGANVFVSNDEGQTWQRRGAVRFPSPDWHEHMIVERRNGTLWMIARMARGLMESTSDDGGRTWTPPVESSIRNPNARFHIRRLASGRLLLIKHGDRVDAHEGRIQLSAWLSDDDGASWLGGLVLDERKGVSYPDGFQAPDGTVFISYDRNRSTDGEILLARFTEEDILATKLVSSGSKLRILISRPRKPR